VGLQNGWETYPLVHRTDCDRQLIQMRGGDVFASLEAQIRIAKVIGNNDQHIWPLFAEEGCYRTYCQKHGDDSFGEFHVCCCENGLRLGCFFTVSPVVRDRKSWVGLHKPDFVSQWPYGLCAVVIYL
jgi:hypothetical protein